MSENFEETKQSLLEVEKKIAIKSNPAIATIIDSLKALPLVGLSDNIINQRLSDSQQKKQNELLNIINSNSEIITSDMVNDVEFIFNFIKTLDVVNRLARNDKVKYFANLLKNGYLSGNRIESNDFDEYFQILNELSYRQIKYLCLYNKCKKEIGIIEDAIDYPKAVASKFKETLNIEDEETNQILDSIRRTVFMKELIGTYFNYQGGIYYLTDEFDNFAKWIVGDDGE